MALVQPVESTPFGANPQSPGVVLGDGVDVVGGKAVVGGEHAPLCSVPLAQTAGSRHPERPGVVCEEDGNSDPGVGDPRRRAENAILQAE